jgi:hypothetical protein
MIEKAAEGHKEVLCEIQLEVPHTAQWSFAGKAIAETKYQDSPRSRNL